MHLSVFDRARVMYSLSLETAKSNTRREWHLVQTANRTADERITKGQEPRLRADAFARAEAVCKTWWLETSTVDARALNWRKDLLLVAFPPGNLFRTRAEDTAKFTARADAIHRTREDKVTEYLLSELERGAKFSKQNRWYKATMAAVEMDRNGTSTSMTLTRLRQCLRLREATEKICFRSDVPREKLLPRHVSVWMDNFDVFLSSMSGRFQGKRKGSGEVSSTRREVHWEMKMAMGGYLEVSRWATHYGDDSRSPNTWETFVYAVNIMKAMWEYILHVKDIKKVEKFNF